MTIEYDYFTDSLFRPGLETRLRHLLPSEMLLPFNQLTPQSSRLLSTMANSVAAADCAMDKNKLRMFGKERRMLKKDEEINQSLASSNRDSNLKGNDSSSLFSSFSSPSQNNRKGLSTKKTSVLGFSSDSPPVDYSLLNRDYRRPPFPLFRIEEMPLCFFTQKNFNNIAEALTFVHDKTDYQKEMPSNDNDHLPTDKPSDNNIQENKRKLYALPPAVKAAIGALLHYISSLNSPSTFSAHRQLLPEAPLLPPEVLGRAELTFGTYRIQPQQLSSTNPSSKASFVCGSFVFTPLFLGATEMYLPATTIKNLELFQPSTPVSISASVAGTAVQTVSTSINPSKQTLSSSSSITMKSDDDSTRLSTAERARQRRSKKQNDSEIGSLFWFLNRTETSAGCM